MLHPNRYCYFVAGHVMLHAPAGNEADFAAPFQTVVRLERPVTCDADTEALTEGCRRTVEADIGDSYVILGEPILRSVSFLHLIQVDPELTMGAPVNVLR